MPPPDPIYAVLGPRGLLAQSSPNYEDRPQQIAMARLVRRALDERFYAIVEAGTGTGKTLAYLLPALLSGRRVVISTATKTLQEQIVSKDLPLLQQTAGLDALVTVMKGRSNYLCLTRLDQTDSRPPVLPTESELLAFRQIHQWAGCTKTGDQAELDLPEKLSVWKHLSATSESCYGQRCPRYADCFVMRMRKRASESDLVIVNHHLLFADLALKTSPGPKKGAEIIPAYDAVVFDEAHSLEDIATEFFGVKVSDYRIAELVRDTNFIMEKCTENLNVGNALHRLENQAAELFHIVEELLAKNIEQTLRLTPKNANCFRESAEHLQEILLSIKARLSTVKKPEVESIARRCREIAQDLDFLASMKEAAFVYWAQTRSRAKFLCAAPIEIADELRQRLYSRTDTVIFTSATLASQGNLDFVKNRLGLSPILAANSQPRIETLLLDSPFNYSSQAALYLPLHLPLPTDPHFTKESSEEIASLCRITEGRALVLFTSLRNMGLAHQLLKKTLPFPVLLQGERPKQLLIDQFKKRPSVLFASHSFWEGVDIPGEALSLVIIEKLPFSSPGDALIAARIELLQKQGSDAFRQYQIPRAALTLRQGFGRLVRTQKDRGIVAILDRRITQKSYGTAFLDSLPACARHFHRQQIEQWWKSYMVKDPSAHIVRSKIS